VSFSSYFSRDASNVGELGDEWLIPLLIEDKLVFSISKNATMALEESLLLRLYECAQK
jgi:hypothetical protein